MAIHHNRQGSLGVVVSITGGILLLLLESLGLAFVVSEILVPSSHPVFSLGRRVVELLPNLLLLLALPGGWVLLRRCEQELKRRRQNAE